MMDKLRIFRNPWERLSFHSPPSLPPSLPWASARRHTPITPPSTQRQRKGQAFGEDSGPGRLSNYHLVHVPLMFYVGGSLSVGSFQGGGIRERSRSIWVSISISPYWKAPVQNGSPVFGCSSRIKGRSERAWGIQWFPCLHVSSSGTAPLLGYQRHCSQKK